MQHFFTADTHFNHANIIEYTNRPFSNVDIMNEVLIDNWNKKIKDGDIVYHLGDFAFGDCKEIFNRLNGEIHFIEGNHDRHTKKIYPLFKSVNQHLSINIGKKPIFMSHYGHRVWDRSHFNSWHLYGHSHGKLPPQGKSFDVGVDNNEFSPLSFEEVRTIMNTLPDNLNCLSSHRGK